MIELKHLVTAWVRKLRSMDFETLGRATRLDCATREEAIECCACDVQSLEDHTQIETSKLKAQITLAQTQIRALHAYLYDRAIPVNDAEMLTRAKKAQLFLAMAIVLALACLAVNATTGYLLGYTYFLNGAWAVGMTSVPLVIIHLLHEHVLARHKRFQASLTALMALAAFAGFIDFGLARWRTLDLATAQPTINDVDTGNGVSAEPGPSANQSSDQSESRLQGTVGESMFLIAFAAEFGLGLVFAMLIDIRHGPDYAAWIELRQCNELVDQYQHEIESLLAQVEIAKKQCMAGILRAEQQIKKRRPPYHRAAMVLMALAVLVSPRANAQTVQHYEVILLDTSGSVGRDGPNHQLFHQYLGSIRKLLLTEPPKSRVWVLLIGKDSFGGAQELVSGWTPDARGVFAADLNRARRELAAAFDRKAVIIVPNAAGTDIFGGLWRAKILIESEAKSGSNTSASKDIWIFSDMMNETRAFPMPSLISLRPDQMLERAKADALFVPLGGYRIHVIGASTDGSTPQGWNIVKGFWVAYFKAAGAELASYSEESEPAH